MKEKVMKVVFLMTACVSILAVALICLFLFVNGVPATKKSDCLNFLGEQHGRLPAISLESFL